MNRDETIKAIEVMQAWVDGKGVEYLFVDRRWGKSEWRLISPDGNPHWAALLEYELRIKPEPRECWRTVHVDGTYGGLAFDSEADAQDFLKVHAGTGLVGMVGIRKFVEVLE